jgi:predicted polyphosphate/ATP-dependent NAD kinase
MGADEARCAGLEPLVLGSIGPSRTTADDTLRAARDLVVWGAQLLVFAGGDGTARDIVRSAGDAVPVVGIPAGVKIHSSVFATTPRHAGELVREFVGGPVRLEPMEVMDIDEACFREGRVAARLYGYLRVPFVRRLVQRAKAGSRSDPSTVRGVALGVLAEMGRDPDAWYILGPGSTIRAVGDELGIETTLLGVDVVHRGRLVAADIGEHELLRILASEPARHARLVVTVIGGQGYIFGRGNQQLSPAVIRAIGRGRLIVIATLDKLHALDGPLIVDTGDEGLDRELAGYVRVRVGEREEVVWRVSS